MVSLVQKSLRLAGPLMLWVFVSSTVSAAIEEVVLKIDNQQVKALGRRACDKNEKTKVVVELTNAIKNAKTDFQGFFKDVDDKTDLSKTKGDTLCSAKLATGTPNIETFSTADPTISVTKFATSGLCSKDGVSKQRILCIYSPAGEDDLLAYAYFRIETKLAKIDSIDNKSATNGEVSFEVKIANESGNTIKIQTCFGKTSDGNIDADPNICPPKTHSIQTSSSRNVKIKGLDPVEYAFKVKLLDQKDGETEWSDSFKLTPVPVAYQSDAYEGAGGELAFSCAQSGKNGASWFLLALVGLLLVRLRRHMRGTHVSALAFSVVVAGAFVSEPVHADFGQVNIGLLGSMYRPDLDAEKKASGEKIFPFYKCLFRKKTSDANGPINPLMGFEVDVHLFDGFGSLQLGLGAGYTFVTGRAVKLNSDGTPDCNNPEDNATTTLHMYQVRPQLTYVLDHFAEVVPLVPYIRGALIGHGYMFRRGSEAEPTRTGDVALKPNGFRFGYQAAVGLMLMMDFLEPSAVSVAHGSGYLEHVYLKAELSYTKIDTFGRRGYQFSAKDVMGTSLPLLWTFGLVFEL